VKEGGRLFVIMWMDGLGAFGWAMVRERVGVWVWDGVLGLGSRYGVGWLERYIWGWCLDRLFVCQK
jgi:hypothetical protein